MISPPGRTLFLNLSRLGLFIAISVSGTAMMGDATSVSSTTTLQFAVPPRISGPYDGSQVTALFSYKAAYAINCPSDKTPCPPKPAMIIFSILIPP